MRVHIQRRRRSCVAKALRYRRHNNQIVQHLRRHEMPQVMQTNMADSAPANEPDERLGDPVRRPRRSAIELVREHERLAVHADAAIGLARTVLTFLVDDRVVKGDVVTAMCLGGTEHRARWTVDIAAGEPDRPACQSGAVLIDRIAMSAWVAQGESGSNALDTRRIVARTRRLTPLCSPRRRRG